MNDYVELRVGLAPCHEPFTDMAAMYLAPLGYDTFVPDPEGVTAYIPATSFDLAAARHTLEDCPLPEGTTFTLSHSIIPGRDWNEEWEKNYFRPIVVGDKVAIHSSFHTGVPVCEYDIVIDPKMAFGTGHHATTTLMLRQLLGMDIEGKTVIDMGTGTGILAILAAMRGASRIYGIEIDPDAAINAVENVKANHHSEIRIITGDREALKSIDDGAGVFLANINRNIILADLQAYSQAMNPGCEAWFSGFYVDDVPMVRKAAERVSLAYGGMEELDKWAVAKFTKK